MACAACAGVRPGGRVGTSSAQARSSSAQAFQTMELEEAPSDNRNGTRPASSADHRGVAGHVERRAVAHADRAGGPCRRARLRCPFSRRAARGRARGDDGVAVRRRGAAGDRRGRASRRAGGDRRAPRDQETRAKSDRADARHLRELLMVGRLPESWIPPEHLLELRARVRLRHTLVDQRREWQQRIQATLYHHGAPPRSWLLGAEARAWLAALELPPAAREQIKVSLALIDAHQAQLAPLDAELRAYAKRQPGCRALMHHYGIGPLTAVTILAELGDARRFGSSREAVRYSGLDITVHQSDARRAPGRLSRQGPSALRWALFEAAQCARRPASPDHQYYLQTAARLGANRACLAVSRKLLKRSFHTLRELGEEALQPA